MEEDCKNIPKSPKTPKRSNPAGGVKLPCMLPNDNTRTSGLIFRLYAVQSNPSFNPKNSLENEPISNQIYLKNSAQYEPPNA